MHDLPHLAKNPEFFGRIFTHGKKFQYNCEFCTHLTNHHTFVFNQVGCTHKRPKAKKVLKQVPEVSISFANVMHGSSPKGCHPQPFPEMIKTLYFGIAREMHLAPACERFDISWKRPPLPSFTILSSPFDRNNYSWQGGDAALRTIGGVELMLARGSEEQQIGAELHFWAETTSALSDCSWDLIAAAAVISFTWSQYYLIFLL